jgi:hypothetical protein
VGNVTSYRVDGLVEGQTYYFAVTAEDTSGNESGFSIERSAQATTSQPSSVALTASMGNPQVEGATVRFSASASGGSGNFEYRFYENGPHTNGNWVTVRDYSSSNTLDWNTTGKVGQSIIVVWCRNAGTQPDSSSVASVGRYFTVNAASGSAPQPSSAALSTSMSSPQIEGTSVRLTASASGGSGDYEYRFYENGPHTNGNWIVARDYASSNTLDWDTAGKVGQSVIVVWCRNAGTRPDSSSVASAGKYFTVSQEASEPQPDVSLVTALTSPQNAGTTVRFVAFASGGSGDYEYRFYENGPHTNGNWVLAQDYSSSRRYYWNTTGKVGQSAIVVWCRNAGTQPDSASVASAGKYFTIY